MLQRLICPACGAENPLTAETCQKCSASLVDVSAQEIHELNDAKNEDLNLTPGVEDDLPGLLHALKHGGDLDIPPTESSAEELAFSPGDQSQAEPHASEEKDDPAGVPDWLQRIRQRSQVEADSKGEVTQKILAAKESVSDQQSEEFESWIANIRDKARDKAARKASDGAGSSADGDDDADQSTDWLAHIRKVHGKESDSESDTPEDGEDKAGDSLLQWLVALENGEAEITPSSEVFPEEKDQVVEDTQEIAVSALRGADYQQESQKSILEGNWAAQPELIISREEQAQADLLSGTILDEQASRPVRRLEGKPANRVVRLVIGLLVIVGLSLLLFFGTPQDAAGGLLQPHNRMVLAWMDELPADPALLLIFDFHPGFADEISLVATPLLKEVLHEESDLYVLSATPSGELLSDKMFTSEPFQNLSVNNLGYFPNPAFGVFEFANLDQGGKALGVLPDLERSLPAGAFDGVLILADEFEGASVWIEQLSIMVPDAPITLLVTAQAGPMLVPYWQSGQVLGMVSGLSEGAGMEAELSKNQAIMQRWRAYQAGVLGMIALLVVGAFFGETRPQEHENEVQHDSD